MEADHAEDDGDTAEGENGDDAELGAPGHLEAPEGGNGKGEDVEVEDDVLGITISWQNRYLSKF